MKIEVKNIKVNLAFSEATTQFKADIFIDGKKIAYAENHGRGGSTFYGRYNLDDLPILKAAEDFCKSLPAVSYNLGGENFEMPQSLENFIDKKIDDFVNNKEREKFNKKLSKDMARGIVYGDEKAYNLITWGKWALSDLLHDARGRDLIKAELIRLKQSGKAVLNTNLPGNLL